MHRFVNRSFSPPLAALVVACAALLAGCIGGQPACATLPAEIELTLTAETLTPSDPAACRGADVTLTIRSEVDGVFHIHGYDAEVPAANATSGEVLELTFNAVRAGQFPIELHPEDNVQGVNVGIFTVHEP